MAASLGGGVSIDTAPLQYDNGYLACARTGWPNPPGDGNYIQAANNLASYPASTQLVLVGHGSEGLISTGDGMQLHSPQGYISVNNYASWANYFNTVAGHGVILTLCGCDCAGGTPGAQFLSELANLLNMPVRGRTGLVYLSCPGCYISYEDGSQWLIAYPGSTPQPVGLPNVTMSAVEGEIVWFASTGALSLGNVTSVRLTEPGRGTKTLPLDRGVRLLSLANLDQRFTTNGRPGALLTAILTVVGKDNGGKDFEEELLVLNDRLIEFKNNPSVFVSCSPAFTADLRSLKSI
jgi:hypothetical protein